MKTILFKVLKWLLPYIAVICFCVKYESVYLFYSLFVQDKNLITLIVTLISGLFGFVIAVIPFAISMFNQNNRFVVKLLENDNLEFIIRPLFNRMISFLKNMLFLFVALLILYFLCDFVVEYFKDREYFADYYTIKQILVSSLFYVEILLIAKFIYFVYRLIQDLNSLVQIFLKSKESKKDKQ